jgi:ankyrin repeat protein
VSREIFIDAVRKGNVLSVRRNLYKWDIREVDDSTGLTLLHLAAQSTNRNAVQIIKILIEGRAEVNVFAGEDLNTPLHLAAKNITPVGLEILQTLIECHARVDATDKEGQTPLHLAAKNISNGKDWVLFYLIKGGANLLAQDIPGTNIGKNTPLHIAAGVSKDEHATAVIKLILAAKECGNLKELLASKNTLGETPLHKACQGASSTIVYALLIFGSEIVAVDKDKNTPLHHVMKNHSCSTKDLSLMVNNLFAKKDQTIEYFKAAQDAIAQGKITHRSNTIQIDSKQKISALLTKNITGETPLHYMFTECTDPQFQSDMIGVIEGLLTGMSSKVTIGLKPLLSGGLSVFTLCTIQSLKQKVEKKSCLIGSGLALVEVLVGCKLVDSSIDFVRFASAKHDFINCKEAVLAEVEMIYKKSCANHPASSPLLGTIRLKGSELRKVVNAIDTHTLDAAKNDISDASAAVLKSVRTISTMLFDGQALRYHASSQYNDYFSKYSQIGLDTLLHLRINNLDDLSDKKIIIFTPNFVFDGSIAISHKLALNIQLIMTIGENPHENDNIILIPLNLYEKHWVGMVIKTNDSEIKVIYMDPEGSDVPAVLSDTFVQMLQQTYPSLNIIFDELELEHQRYNNCGSEVIENFMLYLTGARIDQESAVAVHSSLLEAYLMGEEITVI